MPEKWTFPRIGMFTPPGVAVARLPLTFEVPLSSARVTPSLPRVARLDHQAIGLVIVFLASIRDRDPADPL
jgi:hypothetical protein